ncbi:nb-arc and tpr domain-containing protein [Ilyonectria robusta]|uniref:nb-arc and tpr domain-containing protein n=1 Tax=Ilyonectria robusta TaxID=1079257 RepID=UPI001E8EBDE0|nr:nb-arc and tpr domain-containing protein [Ilyonectria robusta]KAH8729231.1 nb-arc and tpr domain-containing protein [Ilyonectria robusta]
MVRTGALGEILVDVDKTHLGLATIEKDDPLYVKLVYFFSDFADLAPKNVQDALARTPHHALENLVLRPRSSISSLVGAYSNTPGTTVLTPESGSGVPSQDAIKREKEHDHDHDNALESLAVGGVRFPFLFTASVARNQKFYGRSDVLDNIDNFFGLGKPHPSESGRTDSVEDRLNTPKIFALCGIAGIGKTDTASEYAFTRLGHFDAVIWIYADPAPKIGPQFVELAKGLGGHAVSVNVDQVSAREVVKQWLSSPVGWRMQRGQSLQVEGRWLMIIDNVEEPDDIYNWLPDHGPGCILVTSKYPLVNEKTFRLDNGLNLEPFSSVAGAAMLRKLSDRNQSGDTAVSVRIAEALGGLPLGIAQMSAIIREYHLSFEDFEVWYSKNKKELHELRVKGMLGNYKYTLGTVWAVEKLSNPARALLGVLSVLDPDRIPEKLLEGGADQVELTDYPSNKGNYLMARAELIHTSLVSRNMAANELRIHRVVQEVVRQKKTEVELRHIFAAAAILISSVWPFVSGTDPTRNQAWRVPVADTWGPHISKLQSQFGSQIEEERFEGTATSGYVFSSYAWYLSERGMHEQAKTFTSLAEKVLNAARRKGDGDQDQILHWLGEAHHSASFAACMTGSSDGIQYASAWIDILNDLIKKQNKPQHVLALATAYNQMGICCVNKDMVPEAMDSFNQSLTTFKGVHDAPQFSGTFPAISLSLLYVLEGRPDEAEEILSPVLEEHERLLGVDDLTTTESGHIWRTMGNIRNAQRRYPEALDYHERAVKNIRTILGRKHYFAGDCSYSVAMDLMRQGRLERAREHLDVAIEAFAATSHSKSQEARALWKKGCLLKQMGDKSGGQDFLQEAMKRRRKLVPGDDRNLEELKDEDWTKLVFYWSR